MRHGAGDIVRYGNSINMSCEAPETGHKDWNKGQGGKTNQGPALQLSMMLHTLRKEASAMLCDAVQGVFLFTSYTMHILHSLQGEHILHMLQIEHILHILHRLIIVNFLLSQD